MVAARTQIANHTAAMESIRLAGEVERGAESVDNSDQPAGRHRPGYALGALGNWIEHPVEFAARGCAVVGQPQYARGRAGGDVASGWADGECR